MNRDKLAIEAFRRCVHKYECRFDPSMSTKKRNLLFVTLLSFASLMVSPKDGVYNINLGVISGVVEKPYLIFSGLLLVCLYHVYLYWINCRQTILNSINFGKIEEIYMFELASVSAFKEWNELVRQHVNKSINMAIGSFIRSPKSPQENGNWKVRAEIQSEHLKSQENLLKALQDNNLFELGESRGFSQIDYIYKSKIEDYQYINLQKDQFWLTKKKDFMEYVLPLILGYVAIISLIWKIVPLINNAS